MHLNSEPVNDKSDSVLIKSDNNNTKSDKYTIKVYKARWLMLVIFMLCSVCSQIHLFQILIIGHVLVKFYPVDIMMMRLTGLISSVNFLIFLCPNCYLLNKLSMRQCLVIGMTVTTIGAWLKVVAVRPEWFNFMLVAQFIAISGQGVLINSCAKFSSLWFPNNEISTACCIAQTGVIIGIALGFFMPPLLVLPSEDPSQIGKDLRLMLIGVAVFTSVTLLSTLIFFKHAPQHPPSISQALATTEAKKPGLITVAKTVLTKKSYFFFILTSAMANGHFVTMNNLIGSLFIAYFPEHSQSAGMVCTIEMTFGIFGMLLGGVILDKFKKYKETLVASAFLTGFAVMAIGFSLEFKSIVCSYVAFATLGFIEAGMLAISFEVLAEATYPESSLLTATYLSAANFTFATIFTSLLNVLFTHCAPKWTVIALWLIIMFAACSMIAVPIKLRRQNAQIL